MAGHKRYDGYEISKVVMRRASDAFRKYLWERSIDMPDDMETVFHGLMEEILRTAINAGRSSGWFTPQFAEECGGQCYKVHLWAGEDNQQPARSMYGFHEMQAGQAYVIHDAPLPKLRAAASAYGKDHGLKFSVRKIDGNSAQITVADLHPQIAALATREG